MTGSRPAARPLPVDPDLGMLHGRSAPPGMERRILRLLPRALAGGVALLMLLPVLARLWPRDGSAADIDKAIRLTDYVAFAAGLTFLTAVFTVAIGCIIVVIMKGPAYVADAYYIDDAPRPR